MAVLVSCSWHLAHAETGSVIIAPASPIQTHFEYWEDPTTQASIDQVVSVPDSQWQEEASGRGNYGMTTSAYWLRFTASNQTPHSQNLIAELAYSQLDDVAFYVYSGNTQTREFRTGDTRPFYPRDVDHPNMLLRFKLAPDTAKTVYIRVETAGSMILPLHIWREHQFFEAAVQEQKLHFFFYGSLAVIILINLAVFLSLREKLYLYYALAIFGYLMFFTSIEGFSFQHFYPNAPSLHGDILILSMPGLALFSILFCLEFLKIKEHSPKLHKALLAMLVFEVSYFMIALTLSYHIAVLLAAVSAFVFFSLLVVAGPISWAAGVRAGAFFTVAWVPLTVGVLATAGRALGVFPGNFFTEYAMQMGSGLEAFILTLALADRLYREREQKIRAQADSLRQEKARSEAQNRLTDVMTHDPVTGLPNRNRFEWMVDRQLAEDPDGHYMVGVARITRMDEINRTLGLSRSEALLKRIAEQMTELAAQLPLVHTTRDDQGRIERVYQLSGDSFGLLVDAGEAGDDFQRLDNALRLLSEPVLMDNLAIQSHPRFGAASYPEHGDKAALLIRNAHVGMERAGQSRYQTGFYSQEHDIYSESRLTLMSDLREALIQDQTQLHYQPKVCLNSGDIVGLEALIRWHHPERGWVAPIDFIPLAEETGDISQLTWWVVDRALADLVGLHADYPTLTMSLNVSARDLVSSNLKKLFESQLQKHNLQADKVTVELTETAAMEDRDRGLQALQALTELGVKVSIDDFGSGYSSLSYLKQLPATEIKLDRSLILDIDASESSRVIVATAIRMAKGLGYQVVGEGVENEDAASLLREMGCDMLQGYWVCCPQALPELKSWLAEGSYAARARAYSLRN